MATSCCICHTQLTFLVSLPPSLSRSFSLVINNMYPVEAALLTRTYIHAHVGTCTQQNFIYRMSSILLRTFICIHEVIARLMWGSDHTTPEKQRFWTDYIRDFHCDSVLDYVLLLAGCLCGHFLFISKRLLIYSSHIHFLFIPRHFLFIPSRFLFSSYWFPNYFLCTSYLFPIHSYLFPIQILVIPFISYSLRSHFPFIPMYFQITFWLYQQSPNLYLVYYPLIITFLNRNIESIRHPGPKLSWQPL